MTRPFRPMDSGWRRPAGRAARLLSVSDGNLLMTVSEHERDVRSLAFSPDGNSLALGSEDGFASLWKIPEGTLIWKTSTVPAFQQQESGQLMDVQ